MLDIHTTLCQTEIRCVGPTVILSKLVFVDWLVFVGDPVDIQPVRDLTLFEASYQLALQRAKLMRLYILVVLIACLEIPFVSVWPKKLREPFDQQGSRFPEVGELVFDDISQVGSELRIIACVRCQGRALALGFFDNAVTERMEGLRIDRRPTSLLDPVRHFLGSLGAEGHQ